MVSQWQVFICLGILVALAVGLPLEHGMHSISLFGSSVAWWRIMLGLAVVPAVAQVCRKCQQEHSPALGFPYVTVLAVPCTQELATGV